MNVSSRNELMVYIKMMKEIDLKGRKHNLFRICISTVISALPIL